ncbi:hypothetical protein DWZ14_14395 [Enterocloster citroniae]|nr:hypothetical protein DWZ14_14395 [Enterocloster citroniae]
MLEGAVCVPAEHAPKTLDGVTDLVLVFGFLAYDTARVLKEYLQNRRHTLTEIKIWVVGVGLAKQAALRLWGEGQRMKRS